MCSQIDELLKRTEYDIYNNPDVSDEGIKTIAEMIAADKRTKSGGFRFCLNCYRMLTGLLFKKQWSYLQLLIAKRSYYT